jgi:hypothetical protein
MGHLRQARLGLRLKLPRTLSFESGSTRRWPTSKAPICSTSCCFCWRSSAGSMRATSRRNPVFPQKRSPIIGTSPGVSSSNALEMRRSVSETWPPTTSRIFPVRLVPGVGPRRPVPPRPRHSQQSLRAETDRAPQTRGDRRTAGHAEPGDLDWPPGPSLAVGGDSDGAESVRTHRLAARRCCPRHRCAPPLRGQRQEGTLHSAPPGSGRVRGGMVTSLDMPPGRFRPDDELLAFLKGL